MQNWRFGVKKFIFLLPFLLLINGCVMTKSGPIYQEAPKSLEGHALAYLYRPKTGKGVLGYININVDGEPVCTLGQGNYCYLYLKEGPHRFGNKGGRLGDEDYVEVTLKPGETIYVEVGDRTTCQSGCYSAAEMTAAFGIYKVVNNEYAITKISEHKLHQGVITGLW